MFHRTAIAVLLFWPALAAGGQHATGTEPGYFAERGVTFDPATQASVWPWRRFESHQQLILGFILHPIVATGYRPPARR